jgi:hypothetical protein
MSGFPSAMKRAARTELKYEFVSSGYYIGNLFKISMLQQCIVVTRICILQYIP